MNNYDKTYVYDERPGFESYNAFNMQYPNIPVMPYMAMPMNQNNGMNNLESRISTLENKISNLENKIQRLENSIYPSAVDYSTTKSSSDYLTTSYQNSMNIM